MNNIIKRIEIQSRKELAKFKRELKEEKTIEGILSKWHYRNRLTKTTLKKQWISLKELKDYLMTRELKMKQKELEKQKTKVSNILNSGKSVESITIGIEWKRSSTWGHNPTATVTINFDNYTREEFSSGSIGGCGYDKESTAIAKALNQCNELMKKMYLVKNKKCNTKKDNRQVFGYGSGYGILPYFEGGVGTSCYYEIFKKLKMKFKRVSGGKSFDVYEAK